NVGSPESCRRLPLSPSEGERVEERGPTWGSERQNASECREGVSQFMDTKGHPGHRTTGPDPEANPARADIIRWPNPRFARKTTVEMNNQDAKTQRGKAAM